MASPGLACLLEVAVTSAAGEEWSSPDSSGASSADPTDDRRKSAWGQKRIEAELARLGFTVSARTVAKVYEFATQSRAVLGLAKILEPP
jgi:hypothetical protein